MPCNCSVGGSLGVPGAPQGCGGFGAVTASLLGMLGAEEAGLGALPRKPASREQEPSSEAHLVGVSGPRFFSPPMKQHTCTHPPFFRACGD